MRSNEDSEIMEKFNNKLNDFNKVDTNICSAKCCGSQYPVSFDIKKDNRVIDGKYVPTNFTCTGHHGTGCVCITKDQRDYLADRAENA